MPRYYKDKIFSKWEKSINSKKTEIEKDKKENEEIDRLKKIKADIGKYQSEQKKQYIENKEKTINKNRKL